MTRDEARIVEDAIKNNPGLCLRHVLTYNITGAEREKYPYLRARPRGPDDWGVIVVDTVCGHQTEFASGYYWAHALPNRNTRIGCPKCGIEAARKLHEG